MPSPNDTINAMFQEIVELTQKCVNFRARVIELEAQLVATAPLPDPPSDEK